MKWAGAMDVELGSIESLEVWGEYYGPKPLNPLQMVWIYKLKENCHGDPLKYNACFCVQGFDQIEGLDYFETFAPTGKPSTLRMLIV